MNAAIEDALVEWYETERQAREAGTGTRRGDVIDLDTLRVRQNPALVRLFGAVEQTVAALSLIQPVTATDLNMRRVTPDIRVHA